MPLGILPPTAFSCSGCRRQRTINSMFFFGLRVAGNVIKSRGDLAHRLCVDGGHLVAQLSQTRFLIGRLLSLRFGSRSALRRTLRNLWVGGVSRFRKWKAPPFFPPRAQLATLGMTRQDTTPDTIANLIKCPTSSLWGTMFPVTHQRQRNISRECDQSRNERYNPNASLGVIAHRILQHLTKGQLVFRRTFLTHYRTGSQRSCSSCRRGSPSSFRNLSFQ